MSKVNHTFVKPFIISCLAALAMMAVWFTLSARLDAAIAWFGLVAAVDIALLERWTRGKGKSTAFWIAPLLTLIVLPGQSVADRRLKRAIRRRFHIAGQRKANGYRPVRPTARSALCAAGLDVCRRITGFGVSAGQCRHP